MVKGTLLVPEVETLLALVGILAILATSLPLVHGTYEPRLLPRSFPRPILLEIIVPSLYPSPRGPNSDANERVERGIYEKATATC